MNNRSKKILIIGGGWWGKNIIRTLKNDLDYYNLVCFDPSLDVLRDIKNTFSIRVSNNLDELLNDRNIFSVCIASPPDTHYHITKLCLNAGKNVLVEKPPVSNLDELDTLNNLAVENRLIYMLDCLYVFSDSIQKLKQSLKKSLKTKIRFVHFKRLGDELRRENAGIDRIKRTMFDNNVDVVDDLFFHDAGLLFYLFDSNYVVNSSQKLNLYHESIYDTVFIDMTGDFKVKIDLSWTLTPRQRSITIFCDDRIIEFDAFNQKNQLSISLLNEMRNNFINYKNNRPLTNMLKYFIDQVSADYRKDYLGNYEFMHKIMKMRLSI